MWIYNFDTSEEEEPEWGVPELNGCSHAMELGYLFGWVGGELILKRFLSIKNFFSALRQSLL